MEHIKLSPRLLKIASLVSAGARVADVGTDHGYIPVWLVQNGVCSHVLATDIRPLPLSRAGETVREAGVSDSVALALCDGLSGCEAYDPDTVIIAGMGGETIAGILERAPRAGDSRLFILQPMSKPEQLRRRIADCGYVITEEHLVRDSGKIYPVILAAGGAADPATAAELFVGRFEQICGDPLFREYLDLTVYKTKKAIAGMERSPREGKGARLAEMREVLSGLIEMKGRI